ncbi:hypothetical protein GCM10010116_57490 [Microbispora rosea subsp. aerata]|nr:hypothetical protein [Microbispora rosea]GGO28666.1 hypothetical protein GCM10010116_57490 [Microbispora rosea subsp. aerata]GIH59156.1 hypothetical protein Mro02_60700 [Microbispora rosea subsp. aerata]GLJ86698.1 hypothetical protein GCM10017588_54370 [Microbispora rosea subsp. aerata]
MRTVQRALPLASANNITHRHVSRTVKMLAPAVAILAALVTAPAPANALAAETYASITCTEAQFGGYNLKYKGWGVQYAPNRQIKITTKTYGTNGAILNTQSTTLYTSSSGSWSTPTYSGYAGSEIGGTESPAVYVSAQYAPSGSFIDDAWDEC